MEITIKTQEPDGLNVCFTNVICETYEQVFDIIKAVEEVTKIKIDIRLTTTTSTGF